MNVGFVYRNLLYLIPGFTISWLALYLYECYVYTPVSGEHPRQSSPPFPDNRNESIFWFVQLSDLHLSVTGDPGRSRYHDLVRFCNSTLKTLDPSLLLVTGDLTDAKLEDQFRSQQFIEEWMLYSSALEETRVLQKYPLLDLRGNHDSFDVFSFNHTSNFYKRFRRSHTHRNTESYLYTHHTPFGRYEFLGMDAAPPVGPRRPLNFFGVLDEEDFAALTGLLSTTRGANHTIWFAHYPTSIIAAGRGKLRELLSSCTAYLCGHLHDLGGVVKAMYGRHNDGHLEAELADWKYNRMYRVLAIDHDLLSFTDVRLGQWPVVMVTNPKDSRFLVPSREPVGRILRSSHIRILVFTPSTVKTIRVFINGHPLEGTPMHAGGPLYVLPWQPSNFSYGQHIMSVSAEDAEGRVGSVTQPFSVDGSLGLLDRLPTMLLLGDIASMFRLIFFTLWSSVLGALLYAPLSSAQRGWAAYRHLAWHKAVYVAVLCAHVVQATGPLCRGELLTGRSGWVFPHGVLVEGVFLPGSLTYLYAAFIQLLSTVPFLAALNLRLSPHHGRRGWAGRGGVAALAVFALGSLARVVWSLYYPYGYGSLLVGPGGSWTLTLYFSLFLKVFILNGQTGET